MCCATSTNKREDRYKYKVITRTHYRSNEKVGVVRRVRLPPRRRLLSCLSGPFFFFRPSVIFRTQPLDIAVFVIFTALLRFLPLPIVICSASSGKKQQHDRCLPPRLLHQMTPKYHYKYKHDRCLPPRLLLALIIYDTKPVLEVQILVVV